MEKWSLRWLVGADPGGVSFRPSDSTPAYGSAVAPVTRRISSGTAETVPLSKAVLVPVRGCFSCMSAACMGTRENELWVPQHVSPRMPKAPEWLIVVGGCVFILMLGLSAYWEPDIRWLHFFQAWMYVATIVLALRRNYWGYFIGLSAAGLWIYANLFATTFFFNGLQQLSLWIRTGHLERADLLIAVPAWFSNLLVVIGCVWGYFQVPTRSLRDAGRFLITFALTTGFFALDMALFQPRYLGLFPRMLHPHLP